MSKPYFVVDTHNRYGERLKIRYESKKGLNLDLCMEVAELARKHKQSLFKSEEKIDMDLIEAAPELLAAAEEVIKYYKDRNYPNRKVGCYERLKKAIQKAKGDE